MESLVYQAGMRCFQENLIEYAQKMTWRVIRHVCQNVVVQLLVATTADEVAHTLQSQEYLTPSCQCAPGAARNRVAQRRLQAGYLVGQGAHSSLRFKSRVHPCHGDGRTPELAIRAMQVRIQLHARRLRAGQNPFPCALAAEHGQPSTVGVPDGLDVVEVLRDQSFAGMDRLTRTGTLNLQRIAQRNPYSGRTARDFEDAATALAINDLQAGIVLDRQRQQGTPFEASGLDKWRLRALVECHDKVLLCDTTQVA